MFTSGKKFFSAIGLGLMVWLPAVAQTPDASKAAGTLLQQGVQAIERDDPGEAIRCFRAALTNDPQSKEAVRGLADALLLDKEYEQALEAYRKYFLLSPRDGAAFARAAICFRKLEQPDRALQYIDHALSVGPKTNELYSIKAELLLGMNNPLAAIAVCEERLKGQEDAEDLLWLRTRIAFLLCFEKQDAETKLPKPDPNRRGFVATAGSREPACDEETARILLSSKTNREILGRTVEAIERYLARPDTKYRADWHRYAEYMRVFAGTDDTDSVTFPRAISIVRPSYKTFHRPYEKTLKTTFAVFVTETGAVADLLPVQTLPGKLTDDAAEAIRQWKFQPGSRDGKPMKSIALVEVNFNLVTP